MRISSTGLCSWLAAVLMAALPMVGSRAYAAPNASADNDAARRLFAQAEARFAAAEYEAALALFRQAMAAAPHDALLFNMAVCLERLGRVTEARETYEAAARSAMLDDQARARARLAALQLAPPPAPNPPPPAEPSRGALDLTAPAPRPATRPLLGAVGWGGVAAAAVGTAAGTTLWLLGRANQGAYEDAIAAEDQPRAERLANRADAYDTWHKVSVGLALLGVAVTVADVWRRAGAADAP